MLGVFSVKYFAGLSYNADTLEHMGEYIFHHLRERGKGEGFLPDIFSILSGRHAGIDEVFHVNAVHVVRDFFGTSAPASAGPSAQCRGFRPCHRA